MVTDRGITLQLGNKSNPSAFPTAVVGEGLWRTIFEAVDCGLLVLAEPHQVIVEANAAICERWQIPREELLGLRLSHVVSPLGDELPALTSSGRITLGPATGCEVRWRLQSIEGSASGTWVAIFGAPAVITSGDEAMRHDSITRLPNRQTLEEVLARRLSDQPPFALLFLDLDGFKQVNDRFGHLAGDDVLREVGRRLAGTVRDGDLVARYGGDEFVVLAEGIATARDAARVAKRISAALERAISSAADNGRRTPLEVQLGVSIGLALAGEAKLSARGLLERADRDMYRRKRLRRRRKATQQN